jgi:hypothetical protein
VLPLLRASFSEEPQEERVSKRVPANPSFDWRGRHSQDA